MHDRLKQFLTMEGLSPARFAEVMGIQRSGISHLLSGRNNPSLDFVKKLKETFPEYTLDWIVFGEGPMTVSEPFFSPSSAIDSAGTKQSEESEMKPVRETPILQSESREGTTSSSSHPTGIVLLFDDDTYKFLSPR